MMKRSARKKTTFVREEGKTLKKDENSLENAENKEENS